MCEQDKITIKEGIREGMKPVYWVLTAVLTIFLGISGPLTWKVFDLQERLYNKADYGNVVNKYQYRTLIEDQHRFDIQAIQNPDDAKSIYDSHSYKLDKDLNISFRGE